MAKKLDREEFLKLIDEALRKKIEDNAWGPSNISYASTTLALAQKDIAGATINQEDYTDGPIHSVEVKFLAGTNINKIVSDMYTIFWYIDTPIMFTKVNGMKFTAELTE